MKVLYIFSTPNSASYILGRMILPQLENDATQWKWWVCSFFRITPTCWLKAIQ